MVFTQSGQAGIEDLLIMSFNPLIPNPDKPELKIED
jgi:hypothetical protein